MLMGLVSVGSWIVTAQVDAELDGFAKQIDVAGSLRYRLLRLAAQRATRSAANDAAAARLISEQRRVLDDLLEGDPATGLPACGSPLICTRLREHKKRLSHLAVAGWKTDAASGLPAPIVAELESLDATVHEIATEVQTRVDRVALTSRLSAVSTLLLLGLSGFGVWTVFRRIGRVSAAAGQASSSELSRIARGTDEVANLAEVLASTLGGLEAAGAR